jgi:lipid-binding SYLF domain-containing protein
MEIQKNSSRMVAARLVVAITSLAIALVLVGAVPALADHKLEATQLVEKAGLTLQNFICDDNLGAFRDLLKKAEGVLIAPEVLKGAFVIGASGGSGVLLVRDKKTEKWSEPAFYTMGGASFGLQIGGQASEVILLAMTDRGVRSLLGDSVKLGADVGVAAGPMGIGASAATANLSADILSFSRSKGLYGGVSLDGAVVAVRGSLNNAFYGKEVSPTDILIRHTVTNQQAEGLAKAVARSTSKEAVKECVARTSKEHYGG